MIIRILFILISFQLSLIESCVRTIPPEEVYITSTPDNLPITDAPVTNAPVTDAPVTDAPITDAPITDAPITDDPVDPENLCMECDVKAVSPIPTDAAITFTSNILSKAGECLVTEMICERTDDKTCDNAQFVATTAAGPVPVTNSLTATKTTTILSCNEDGTFSAGSANGITKLECIFDICVEPPNLCTQCDSKAIVPELPDTATTFSVETLSDPGECFETRVTCQRDDDKTCVAVNIEAITAGGQSVITDSSTPNSATSTITCAKDGTYSWGATTTGITKLVCIFENCASPCTTCDASAIAPVLTDIATSFVFLPLNFPGACLNTQMICQRNDGKTCDDVKLEAITTTGRFSIKNAGTSSSASTTIQCGADGKYLWEGTVTGITQLECIFENCVSPCETCQISDIAPDGTANSPLMSFDFTQTNLPGTCLTANAACYKIDGLPCPYIDIKSDVSILLSNPWATSVNIPIRCDTDGQWKLGSFSLSRLSCVHDC